MTRPLPPPTSRDQRYHLTEKHWWDPTTWPKWAQIGGVIFAVTVWIPLLASVLG